MTSGELSDPETAAASAEAVTASANRLLVGQGAAGLMQAFELFTRAAGLGSGEAAARLAVFSAGGILRPPNWDQALDHLQRAAELGWAPAQHELRLLAGGESGSYAALRAQVDIAAWIAPRPRETISDSPRIRRVAAFLSAEECQWLIERGRHKLAPALVYDERDAGFQAVGDRTNSAAEFTLADADVALVLLHARMAATIGLPSQLLETTQLLHYAPGQQFLPHYDFFDPQKPGLAAHVEKFGQRIATILIYLNDDYEGGETDFPRLEYRFKGRTGDALLFANVDPSNAPDYRTLHAGLAPLNGEKWLLSQWVRNRVADPQAS
jgi:prolyl 4-hydroxylase